MGLEPTTNPESLEAFGAARLRWVAGRAKTLEHGNGDFRVLFALQLTLKGPSLIDCFEFQYGNGFQLFTESLGGVGASVAMLGQSSLQVNRRADIMTPC